MNRDALPIHPSYRAQVLVAEDDAPSGQFFVTALQAMHCRADLASTGRQALTLAREHRYDLLLLDCRMPDFGAVRILSALRDAPDAASHASPALATSAELDPVEQRHFRQIGFADALLKPVSLQTLREFVDAWLPAATVKPHNAIQDDASGRDGGQCPPYQPNAVLDDAAALAHSGSASSVATLRQLFVRELGRLLHELDHQADKRNELSETLHRLLASCGFCGASALATATGKLKLQLDTQYAVSPADMQQFRDAIAATLDALARIENV